MTEIHGEKNSVDQRIKVLQVGFAAMFVVLVTLVCLVLFKPVESATSSGTCLPVDKGGTGCDSLAIKSMYEDNADTNAFTDDYKAKLDSLLATSSDSGTITIDGQPFSWYLQRIGNTRRIFVSGSSTANVTQGMYQISDFLQPQDASTIFSMPGGVFNSVASTPQTQVTGVGRLSGTTLWVHVLTTSIANTVQISFFYAVP